MCQNHNKMASGASKGSLDCIKENGIINEVANEGEENFPDVFNNEAEETRSNSSSESNSTTSTLEKGSSRKRSVLKRGGEQRVKPSLQKRVSFSSVPSERRRRVSSGKLF